MDRIRIVHKPRDKKVVLFVGNLSVYKGVLDVLKAVKIVHNESKVDVELRVIGGGNLERSLRNYVKSTNMNYVKIIGKIPHNKVLEEYARADVAVLPFKRPEPFGRVIVEAMAAGVPVVSYAVGAVPEIITHGETGVLVKLNNVEMLAKLIKSLLEDEKLRKTIGERARKVATDRYNPKKVAKDIITVYEDVLCEK